MAIHAIPVQQNGGENIPPFFSCYLRLREGFGFGLMSSLHRLCFLAAKLMSS
jgi:hypothetical protein